MYMNEIVHYLEYFDSIVVVEKGKKFEHMLLVKIMKLWIVNFAKEKKLSTDVWKSCL